MTEHALAFLLYLVLALKRLVTFGQTPVRVNEFMLLSVFK